MRIVKIAVGFVGVIVGSIGIKVMTNLFADNVANRVAEKLAMQGSDLPMDLGDDDVLEPDDIA